MQMQLNQVNRFNHFSNHYVTNAYGTNTNVSMHSRRRMMESQEKAQESEAVRVTISGEAMELARQAKAMERLDDYMKAQKSETESDAPDQEEEKVQLTDEELYDELLDQVKIWGDKSHDLLHNFNHKETAEMAEKSAAALHEMQNLEEMQKAEISKIQREAQKAAEMASMQQEEISRKNSELIMMIESFEDQEEEAEKAAEGEGGEKEAEQTEAAPAGSMMAGEFGAMAVKGELGVLDTINSMDQSSAYRTKISDESIKAVETERKNIYRANASENFTMKEKLSAMEDFVCALANKDEVKKSFEQRIEKEQNPEAKKKLEAMLEYFKTLNMKNGFHTLEEDREFALQERITARDLRIAHLGDNHFSMAEHQKRELQSLLEANILKSQGQNSVLDRMEDVSKRLQEKLDERDHIDEELTPDEEIRDQEEQEELKSEEALESKNELEKNESETEELVTEEYVKEEREKEYY